MIKVPGMIALFISRTTKMFATGLFKMAWYIEKHFNFQTQAFIVCLPFLDPLCETGSAANGCLCLTAGYAFN